MMKNTLLAVTLLAITGSQSFAENYSRDSQGKVLYTSDLSESKKEVGKRQENDNFINGYGNKGSHWQIKAGDLVSETVLLWAKSNGWQLQWELKKNYITQTKASFNGSIQNAVDKLLMGINVSSESKLQATFYTKNRVIRISEK